MASSKTRFGFFSDGGEPPDEDGQRTARTVIGHDIHLQMPVGFVPPKLPLSPTPLPPAAQVPLPHAVPVAIMPEEITEQILSKRGNPRGKRLHKSRIARFLGRWTESGRFESQSCMDALDDDPLKVPRDTTGRNVLLFLIVALLTFLVTIAIVKLRQRYASTGPSSIHLVVEYPRLPISL
jgi:hypothetical protein